ncbi:MAG: hypothetical protein ACM65M_19720 [Microcoleus sp.]
MMHKFAAAAEYELIVFGAARPGYRDAEVARWIEFMQGHSIKQVCCLLAQTQLIRYRDLLGTYGKMFGSDRVCSAPIADEAITAVKKTGRKQYFDEILLSAFWQLTNN